MTETKADRLAVVERALRESCLHNEALAGQVTALRRSLEAAREEIDRWGYGDFHYGPTPREKSVVDALAAIDEALS